MTVKMLPLSILRTDGGTQMRERIASEHVSAMADIMRDDGKRNAIPAVGVIFDSVDYWVWDGNHRLLAAAEAGLTDIRCSVEKGTQRDAILKAAGANQTHGMPRSNIDKRKAVGALLADPEWVTAADNWIADTCGVSNHLVADVRKATASQVGNLQPAKRKAKDGKSYPAKKTASKRRTQKPLTPTFIDDEQEAVADTDADDVEPVETDSTEASTDASPVVETDRGGGDRVEWVIAELQTTWNDYVGVFGNRAERYAFIAGLEAWQVRSEQV